MTPAAVVLPRTMKLRVLRVFAGVFSFPAYVNALPFSRGVYVNDTRNTRITRKASVPVFGAVNNGRAVWASGTMGAVTRAPWGRAHARSRSSPLSFLQAASAAASCGRSLRFPLSTSTNSAASFHLAAVQVVLDSLALGLDAEPGRALLVSRGANGRRKPEVFENMTSNGAINAVYAAGIVTLFCCRAALVPCLATHGRAAA